MFFYWICVFVCIHYYLVDDKMTFLGADSFLFLRQAETNCGKSFFDSLRIYPQGTIDSFNWLSFGLCQTSELVGLSVESMAQLIVWATLLIQTLLLYKTNELLIQNKTKSLFITLFIVLNPLFYGFTYFDKQLFEMTGLLLLTWLFISAIKTKSILKAIICSIGTSLLLNTRDLTANLQNFFVSSNYGINELNGWFGIPYRIWFFITPILTITLFTLYKKDLFKIKIIRNICITFIPLMFVFFITTDLDLTLKNSIESYYLEQASQFLNTQEKGVILAWWDYGYYWQYKTRMPTITDGGTYLTHQTKLLSEFFISPESKTTDYQNALQVYNKTHYIILERDIEAKIPYIQRIANMTYTQESNLYKLLTNTHTNYTTTYTNKKIKILKNSQKSLMLSS